MDILSGDSLRRAAKGLALLSPAAGARPRRRARTQPLPLLLAMVVGALLSLLFHGLIRRDDSLRPVMKRWGQKSQEAGLTAFQRRAYAHLSRVESMRVTRGRCSFDAEFIDGPWEASPLVALRRMGIGVLPILAEALNDRSLTGVLTDEDLSHGEPVHVFRVNELVANLIRDIANHDFGFVDEGEDARISLLVPLNRRIPELQKQVLQWYNENMDRTPEERKIVDLGDPYWRNRVGAEGWLGEKRVAKALPLLVKRLGTLLAGGIRDTLSMHEIVVLCGAIASIGGDEAYPATKKAFDYLVRYGGLRDVDRALEAMELVGHKAEAEAELKRAYETGDRNPKLDQY